MSKKRRFRFLSVGEFICRVSLYGLACVLVSPICATAGSSPETSLLVVNGDSPLSVRIANEYVHLRGIPENHVVRLEGVPSLGVIPIDDFREKIWFPIRDFIRSHKLTEEIDVISYSGDFPYAVDFTSDIKARKLNKNKYRGRIASLTALTYFARRVEVGDIGYLGINHYFRDFAGPKIKAVTRHPVAFPRLKEKEVRQLQNTARKFLNHKESAAAVENYRKILDSYPADPENWYNLARGQAAAGETDLAIETLTLAVDYGWSNSLSVDRDPYFKSFHSDPRFQGLLERMETAYGPFQLTHGFRSQYVWSNADLAFWEPADSLNQYYLSTMLAYTGVRGNSFPEIMKYLTAAASSDGTRPDGSVYLLANSNVRSKTRQPLFPVTLAELAERGRKAEVLHKGDRGQNGILPIAKADVIGAVAGYHSFKWEEADSRLLPGAIAESFTSYGGDFNNAAQTKLTEFLRHGAAGSSGAVAEPFSFQEKFPVPMIHAYYADGCSLAESFYQSVRVPYQLIIVGDPLARPFAAFTDVKLKSPQPKHPWSGIVAIEPDIKPPQGKSVSKVEFWLDGHYLFDVPADGAFPWDTRTVEDGSHDIRLVAIEESGIETRSSSRYTVHIVNNDHRVGVENVSRPVSYADTVEITGTAPGAERVEMIRGYRTLGAATVKDSQWRIAIPASKFGVGPVSFFVRASYQGGSTARSDPVELSIGVPGSLAPVMEEKPHGVGLSAIVYDNKGNEHRLVISELDGPLKELRKIKLKAAQLRLDGFFHVVKPGFYQLVVKTSGRISLSVNDQMLLEKRLSIHEGEAFLPISLQRGWYKLGIDLAITGRPFLEVVLAGDQPPLTLAGNSLGRSPDGAGK
jgi:tetratricopeptide (TPR) repeat protein